MSANSDNNDGKLVSFDFVVCGKVTGVWFRKCAQDKATTLGIVGWIENHGQNVRGQAQGKAGAMQLFKFWLENEGSPLSRISNASLRIERVIDDLEHICFSIKK